MVRSCRRYLFPAALVFIVLLVSAGSRVATHTDVRAAIGSEPLFDPLDAYDTTDFPLPVFQPPRLLAGTNSHVLPANANTRNGYCLDVNVDDVTPSPAYAGSLGFRIFAKDPINPASPPTVEVPLPTLGTYVYGLVGPAASAATTFDGLGTADDVYCVVAFAPEGYKNLVIQWHYQVAGDGSDNVVSLPDIPIVTVTLQKIGDGLVGGPAEVCTVGWDNTFLTGRNSNNFAADTVTPIDNGIVVSNPNVFDAVNVVRTKDFSTTPSGGGANVRVEYVRQVGPEWCAGIAADSTVTVTDVQFEFDAVYSRADVGVTPNLIRDKDADDQPVPGGFIALPPGVTIDIVESVELRHVTIDGRVPPRQLSSPLVTGFTHYICLIGTDLNDSLSPANIQFTPIGGPDVPSPTAVNVFHKVDAIHNERLNGVQEDTLCFSFTSPSPGRHTVSAYYHDENGDLQDAFFDTNQDGNGISNVGLGPLVTQWNRIDRTEITRSGLPGVNVVTFSTINVPLQFNVADGTFIGGASFSEWVIGSHNSGFPNSNNLLLDGVRIRAEIIGTCGYFEVPDTDPSTIPFPGLKVITGISMFGRLELNAGDQNPYSPFYGDEDANPDDVSFSTVNDPGCTPNSTVRIKIDVFYPGQTTPAVAEEWVNLTFRFIPPQKQPRVAWAGQYVTITYAFAGECNEQSQVHFVRPEGQSGAFIPDGGITLNGPNHAITDFEDCTATVRYESEDPGEVDVEVFLSDNPYSKFAVPIFFLAFEDITIDATPDQFVSTFGSVEAQIRGWFPGSNPSGRAAETKPDGRHVPANRWVLPDDWNLVRGDGDFRSQNLTMPSAIVTFAMVNEAVRNSYKPPVRTGSAGFFIPDSADDYSFNVNPHTGAVTQLGSVSRPRLMSDPTDGNGRASVATFGDLNLTYEDCPANPITGNPHCDFEHVVGHGRYIAYLEYPIPENRGKWPAIASNIAATQWLWAGYKKVTIVDTASPQLKYVVAHLRDRDGFCDAANFHNVLGVSVSFMIDAGSGIILEAADRPYTLSNNKRFATATTFDTLNFQGQAINTALAKPVIMEDECQAWILVSNSLLGATNVMVTFPAPPSPLPGDVKLTGVQCGANESFTVTNQGTKPVSLAGFGLQSRGTNAGSVEHFDLIGYLEPGKSATFPGGPQANQKGWIQAGSQIMAGANDYVHLTWDQFVVSTGFCDGTINHNTLPASFPPDPEGEIVIDVIINWLEYDDIPLSEGWNLVPTGAATAPIAEIVAGHEDDIVIIYAWDNELQEWFRYVPGAPENVNTLTEFGGGRVYWIQVKRPLTLSLPN